MSTIILTTGAIPVVSGSFSTNKWPFGIIDLNCTGKENNIWDCPYNGTHDYTCLWSHDASVICQGKPSLSLY